jgi:protein-tyrosine phosphatase
LYVGGLVPAPPPGTRAVLNLCETEDPYRAEVHKWEPIRDAEPAPTTDWLREQVAFVTAQREAGRPVYVHCRNGASRSIMVVTAYLMARDGVSRDEALARVRGKRPEARPNPGFLRLLKEWEGARTPPAGVPSRP